MYNIRHIYTNYNIFTRESFVCFLTIYYVKSSNPPSLSDFLLAIDDGFLVDTVRDTNFVVVRRDKKIVFPTRLVDTVRLTRAE